MKKLGLLVVLMALIHSCCVVPNEEEHYVDENFILTNKTEKEMVINGDTRNVRTWEILRIMVSGDSVMVGEIADEGPDCGCGIITDELWYTKEIGDTLYFEYIRKNRFHLLRDFTGLTTEDKWEATMTPRSITSKNMSDTEADLRILEIEREIMSLEREMESLKRK